MDVSGVTQQQAWCYRNLAEVIKQGMSDMNDYRRDVEVDYDEFVEEQCKSVLTYYSFMKHMFGEAKITMDIKKAMREVQAALKEHGVVETATDDFRFVDFDVLVDE